MKYQKLFSISIFHSYFPESENTDMATPAIDSYLEVVPNPDTKARLQDYRLVLKRKPGTLHCLIPIKDNKLPLVKFSEDKFRFYLKIKDPQILQFSDFSSASDQINLNDVMRGIEFPLYTNENLTDSGELELKKFKFKVTDQQPESENPFTNPFYFFLKSNPIDGLPESDFTIINLNNVTITKYEEGTKRLTLIGDGLVVSHTPFWVTYRAIPSWASETFGLIDIVLSASGRDLKYKVNIGTRGITWNYLFISSEQFPNTKKDNGKSISTSLVLLDECKSDKPLSSTIEEAKEKDYPIVSLLKHKHPDSYIYHIPTAQPIPLWKGMQKSICLSKKIEETKKNKKTEENEETKETKFETLISELPNPTLDDQGIVIVNIPPPQT